MEGHDSRHQINLGQLFLNDVLVKLTGQHVKTEVGEEIAHQSKQALDLLWRQNAFVFVDVLHVHLLDKFDHIQNQTADKVDHERQEDRGERKGVKSGI